MNPVPRLTRRERIPLVCAAASGFISGLGRAAQRHTVGITAIAAQDGAS